MTSAGGPEAVAWIRDATVTPGMSIGAAIPPGFASYGTVVIPDLLDEQHRQDCVLVETLEAHSAPQSWWLGYLLTGGSTVPVSEEPTVRLYSGWQYVVVQAGPEEALGLRRGETRSLPDLMFPADRSWLVSTLWDDDWRCFGASTSLARAVHAAGLTTYAVTFDEDATPPGHTAF